MLADKELILATKVYAKENRAKSWYYLLSTLFLLVCAIAGSLSLHVVLLRVVCSVLAGLLMVRLFVIYHDYLHHAILNRSPLAKIIMTLYGIYVLAPTGIWKRSHDYHHKHNSKLYTASIGSYPIVTKHCFLSMTPAERRAYLFTRHPLTILFGYLSMFMVGMCLRSFLCSPRRHMDSLIAIVFHLVIIVSVFYFLGWQAWLFAICIPFLISSCLGAYLFYVQHNFPGVTFTVDSTDWHYESAAMQSSSYLLMNPFMRFMTANIGYHHIHHLNSRIPFYRLPEAMRGIPELQKAKTASLNFKGIRASFRLKCWDPERNEMIGFMQMRKDV